MFIFFNSKLIYKFSTAIRKWPNGKLIERVGVVLFCVITFQANQIISASISKMFILCFVIYSRCSAGQSLIRFCLGSFSCMFIYLCFFVMRSMLSFFFCTRRRHNCVKQTHTYDRLLVWKSSSTELSLIIIFRRMKYLLHVCVYLSLSHISYSSNHALFQF